MSKSEQLISLSRSSNDCSIRQPSVKRREPRRTYSMDIGVSPKDSISADRVATPEIDVSVRQRHLLDCCLFSDEHSLDTDLRPQLSLTHPGSKLHRRSLSYNGDLVSIATREITEVASRVVEHAEELVMHLWEQGWRVVHHRSLPHWLRDNDYLIWGHRPQLTTFQACFRSIFRMHTETINIWTHLIGFTCFLALCISFLVQPALKFPWQEKAVISVFFAGAILALGFSWMFHTVYCHSEEVGRIFNKLDYIGITLLTLGSFVPWLHYSFYCHTNSKILYLSLIVILSLISITVSVNDRFMTPSYRSFRAGVFVALGLSAVIPAVHYTIMEGLWQSGTLSTVSWLLLMALLYISGALIYALRIPERLCPGRFDIWFQSHQIFHVFVVLAALVHLNGIMEIAENRLSKSECNTL